MRVSVQSERTTERPNQWRHDQALTVQAPRGASSTTRLIAWATLLLLAALQAYAHRFAIGPDGVSYLDLSDAVVTGQWSRLLNLYWSPLYPTLIGIARAVTRVGPEHEIQLVHAVNFVCFAAMLAAFEYMLTSILSLASRVRHSALGGRWAVAASYGAFGAFALVMIPLELTTPDLLNAALAFLAFGAMLRLRGEPTVARHAIVLGLALGVAALAKSFMIPWAVVCLATLAFALGRKGVRTSAIAAGLWLVFLIPWSMALSLKAGRPTFGDAGRLTYAWFVNNEDPPSIGGVPPNARTVRTEMILPGVGIANDTSYTDPMWAEPARWNAALKPIVRLSDQLTTLKKLHIFYVENLAPLLFLFFLIAIAPSGTRRNIWNHGWIVFIPALAGLVGYAMVLVATRYVLPFVLTGSLMLLATTPVARRIIPLNGLLGIVVPIGLEALLPQTFAGLSLVASMVGGVLGAVLVRSRNAVVWGLVALVSLVVTRILSPSSIPSFVLVVGVALAILYWRASFAAIRRWRPVWFAQRSEAAFVVVTAVVLLFRLVVIRGNQDLDAFAKASTPNYGNVQWKIAQDLVSHGITPGTRVAIIGPHAESYWARTGRLHIVASVPHNRIGDFWQLPKSEQDKLLAEFAANGATVAIATLGVVGIPTDSTWTPVKYRGRIRFLTRPDSLRLRD